MLSAGGCISIPEHLSDSVSRKGASGVRTWNVLGIRWVETVSFVPGPPAGRHDAHRLVCGGGSATLSIQWGEGTVGAAEAAELCSSALEALDYIAAASGLGAGAADVRLVLVPQGAGLTVRSLGSPAFGRLRPRFVKRVAPSMSTTIAEVQTTLAHEFTHIAAALLGLGAEAVANEDIAWLAGYCASFHARGRLADDALVQAQFPVGSKVPGSALRSNRAGAAVSETIRAIARGETLRAGTPAGERFGALCHARLREYFGQARDGG